MEETRKIAGCSSCPLLNAGERSSMPSYSCNHPNGRELRIDSFEHEDHETGEVHYDKTPHDDCPLIESSLTIELIQ